MPHVLSFFRNPDLNQPDTGITTYSKQHYKTWKMHSRDTGNRQSEQATSVIAEMMATGPLRVRTAATVICIRRAQGSSSSSKNTGLSREEATGGEKAWHGAGGDGASRMNLVFGKSDTATLSSGWDILLGQSEVQNWLKSTKEKDEAMRYPGEWKFAGGTVDPGETPEQAARRELEEEFQLQLPKDSDSCKFHLLSIKQTRPIRNVSNIMYNFVAAAEENPWLQQLDIGAVNAALAQRRDLHRTEVETGSFWTLANAEREQLAPEIRQVQWLDMRTAVLHSFTSMNDTCVPVNDFQREEFHRLGIPRRDPMFLTMASLLEVDSFPSLRSLAAYSAQLCPDQELRRIQWLQDGMLPSEVAAVFEANASPTEAQKRAGMFRTAEDRAAVFTERRSNEDADAASLVSESATKKSRL
ncbi:unnamed protein product [Polarella glacialis]|uniref:Nudix hydrolase domain-containing protein n=1 Tax=Polarella glacialis TaxID=89957 RepID=A0A813FAQ2_POLGL|nr:unnamed protein product [Polarella glacialis]